VKEDDTLYGFEIVPKSSLSYYDDQKNFVIYILNRNSDQSEYTSRLFGIPLLLYLENQTTYQELYRIIVDKLFKYHLLKKIPPTDIRLSKDGDQDVVTTKPKYGGIFNIIPVNMFGDKSNFTFTNDGTLLPLKDGQSIALDWSEEFIEEYYNSDIVLDLTQHVSKNLFTSMPLDNCIDIFTTEEQLGANDAWYCRTCKDHFQAFKKFDLYSVPPLLIIHLKRFSNEGLWRSKIDTLVKFPITGLDLTSRVRKNELSIPLVYDLYAISNHSGSLAGGHYTAMCLHRDGNWYDYNDTVVHPITEDELTKPEAYVLFYRRRDVTFEQINNNQQGEDSDSGE